MDRRRYLQTLGVGGGTLLAGCPALSSGDDSVQWVYRAPEPVRALAAGPDGVFATTTPVDQTTTLAEIGGRAGDERWTRTVAVSGQELSIRRRGTHLFMLNGRTLIVTPAAFQGGSWRRQGATPPVVVDTHAYLRTVAAGRTWLEAVDIPSGNTTWRIDISDGDQIPETQYPQAHAGTHIAVTDYRFPLTARRLADGGVQWQTDDGTGGLVTAADSTFFVGSEATTNAAIHAFHVTNGQRQTILETTAPTAAPTVIGDYLHVRVTGPDQDAIVNFDAASGEQRWRRDGLRGPRSWTTPDTVYAIDAQDRLTALNALTGTRQWNAPITISDRSPRLRFTDQSVIVDTGTQLVAINRQDGTQRWQRSVEQPPDQFRFPFTTIGDLVAYADGREIIALAG